MNSREKHETEHKTMEIQTYLHAFIIRKLHNYYILFLSHLRSCVLKLMSVLQEVICAGIERQTDRQRQSVKNELTVFCHQ